MPAGSPSSASLAASATVSAPRRDRRKASAGTSALTIAASRSEASEVAGLRARTSA